jgi:outer membrane receptor protein involved in Fe transport
MTVSGDIILSLTPGEQGAHIEGTRTDPVLGDRQRNTSASTAESRDRSNGGSLRIDYDLSPKDKLTLSGDLLRYKGETINLTHSVRIDGSGAVIEDLHLRSPSLLDYSSNSLGATWRHNYAKAGQTLVLSGRYSRSTDDYTRAPFFDYASGQPDRIDDRRNLGNSSTVVLSANYTLPLADKALFKMGYDFRKEDGDNDNVATTTDPVTGAVNPLPDITNRFVNVTINHQAFVTYQRPFGKLSFLAGVRLEEALIDYDQRTTAVTGSEDYFQVHPSLHLQYDLAEDQKLNLSYSHRVQRPSGSQLNPFVSFYDAFNASSGNPALRPQETHSVEGEWEWVASKATIGATLYYRQNYNTIGSVSRFLTSQVILSTFENQGTSRTSGLELTAVGKLGPMVSYNASTNLSSNEIQRSSLAGRGTQEAFAYTAQGNLDFRITAKDFIQTRLNYNSRQINAQGFRKASGAIDLGYQRKISDNLVAVLVVTDIFKSARSISVIDTPFITSVTDNYRPGRTFAVSLTRQFGGKAREPQFDYSTGGGLGASGPGGGL